MIILIFEHLRSWGFRSFFHALCADVDPLARRALANEKDLCGGRNELYERTCICTTARSVHEQGELWPPISISHLIIRSLRQKSKPLQILGMKRPLQILGMKRQSSTSRTAFTRVRSHWRTHLEARAQVRRIDAYASYHEHSS